MNLERIRLQLTGLLFLLLVVAVVVLAVVAERLGSDGIYDSAEREVEQRMSALVLSDFWAEDFRMDNTWQVQPDTDWFDPLGQNTVEPPLFGITSKTRPNQPVYETFDQEGRTWLAFAKEVNDDRLRLLVAIDFEGFEDDVSSLRWRLFFASAGLIAAATLAAWWLAGRSLRPARQALSQQRNFIADAAHELRTPLAVIQASASQTLSRPREDWEYERSLSEIQLAAERAGRGVGSLLELARLESGQVAPRLAPLRLDLLVEELAASTRLDNVALTVTTPEPLIVNADYTLLRQALGNLLNNAAARATSVSLIARRAEPWALIEVIDDGPGFDPAVLDTVFERFGRGDEKGSSGLGMSIVKTVMDAHRGTVEAANRPEGGALVTVKLKISAE